MELVISNTMELTNAIANQQKLYNVILNLILKVVVIPLQARCGPEGG